MVKFGRKVVAMPENIGVPERIMATTRHNPMKKKHLNTKGTKDSKESMFHPRFLCDRCDLCV